MRRPRCGGLMVHAKSEDSRRESNSDECSGCRDMNCGAIANPLRAAHRWVTSSAVVSTKRFTPQSSSLSSSTIRSNPAHGMSKSLWLSLLHDAFT